MPITTCPTCGSRRIRRQVIDLEITVRNKTKTVPQIELEICPACGEKLFDDAAMEKVEKVFPPRPRKMKTAKRTRSV